MQFEKLTAAYSGEKIFENLQGKLALNKVTTLLGPNGSGKTTLMMILAGLKKPTAGKIELEQRKIFYLPQKNQVYDYLTVAQLLAIPQTKASPGSAGQFYAQLIEKFGLTDLLNRDLNRLSGGQQQRAWLAYALLQPADILLLDEPLAYLDLKYQQEVLKLVSSLKSAKTFLLSLHDVKIARYCSDFVWLLSAKKIAAGPPEILTSAAISNFLKADPQFLIALQREGN